MGRRALCTIRHACSPSSGWSSLSTGGRTIPLESQLVDACLFKHLIKPARPSTIYGGVLDPFPQTTRCFRKYWPCCKQQSTRKAFYQATPNSHGERHGGVPAHNHFNGTRSPHLQGRGTNPLFRSSCALSSVLIGTPSYVSVHAGPSLMQTTTKRPWRCTRAPSSSSPTAMSSRSRR